MSEEFSSALIYLTAFASSIGLFWMGQKLYAYGKSAYIQQKIVFLLAVLIPCLLAGFRANSVGIDVEVYVVPDMRMSASAHIQSFADCCSLLDRAPEYLYMLLVYLCSRITADEGLLLFMLQFLTITPILLAVVKMRKDISVPLAMATYLFCFYNNSLNMMRQSVACSFILLGAVYIFEHGQKINAKAVICFIVAFLFHNSAFIGIIAVYVLCAIPSLSLKKWAYILIYSLIILIPIVLTPIFELFNSLGLISEKLISYADIFLYRTGRQDWFFDSPFTLRFFLTTLCLVGRLTVPCFCLKNYKYYNDSKITTIRSAAICGTMIYLIIQYTMNTIYGNRVSVFLDIFTILLVPYAAQGKNKKTKRGILWMMIITFWILWVMVLKWSGESDIYKFRF